MTTAAGIPRAQPNSADPEALWLRGDGLRLRADAWGPAGGEPVIFLHGGAQSRWSWRGAAMRLGDAGYRALSIDLRGHGDSEWAVDGDYLLDAYARDVEAVLADLAAPAVLVGASRGGQAALVAASRRPGPVRLVLLADVTPTIDPAGVDRVRAFFATSTGGFASAEEAAAALERFSGRRSEPRRLVKAMRRRDSRYYWQWDPRIAAPPCVNPPSEDALMLAAATAVRVPVMLVRGGASEMVRDGDVAAFRALLPALEVHEVAGVGHMLTGDSNDVFADALLDRLGKRHG